MYLLLTLAPIICFTILVASMVGMGVAYLRYDNTELALGLFIAACLMPIPMLGAVQVARAHTEQNLVVTESGQVAEVIANVHSVYSEDDVVTYTYRDGRVGHIITSIDRRVDVQNSHPYHMN